jgi:hypothetical protein
MTHSDRSRPDLEALAKRLHELPLHALELVKFRPELAGEEELERFLADLKAALAATLDHDHEAMVALGLKKRRGREPFSRGARALRKATQSVTRQLRHVMGLRRKLMIRPKDEIETPPLEEEATDEGQAPAP